MRYDDVRNLCIEHLMDELKEGIECYAGDLHDEVFNMDPILNYSQAQSLLNSEDGYKIIGEIVSYELNCFGEVFPEDVKRLNDIEWLGNMIVYIKGDELIQDLLSRCPLFYEAWDSKLNTVTRKQMYNELKKMSLEGGK